MTTVRIWNGGEWEAHINALLSLRYPPGQYQRVPAEHGGDCGIEGFGIPDGHAYQCYAPSEPLPVRELHERQRDKMTADIKKFIANRFRLKAILGHVRISRWLLVVPEHRSAHLVEHCSKKTDEVLGANLPYVTSDFRVVVITDDEFALERRSLASAGATHVQLEPLTVDVQTVDAFAPANSLSMANLQRKIAVALEDHSQEQRDDFVSMLIRSYLTGQSQLDRLHRNYPAVYSQLRGLIARAEKRIAFESTLTSLAGCDFLHVQYTNLLEGVLSDVQSAVPIAEDLVLQAIADWLMRCPLDFRRASAPTDGGLAA